MFYLCPFKPLHQPTLSPRSSAPSKHIRVLGWTWKIHSNISLFFRSMCMLNLVGVLESSKPYIWPRGVSKTVWHVFGLGLEAQMPWPRGSVSWVQPFGWHSTARHPSTAGSGKWLYYRARCEMDALNSARRDALHRSVYCTALHLFLYAKLFN